MRGRASDPSRARTPGSPRRSAAVVRWAAAHRHDLGARQIDAKHAQLLSAFAAATQSGDLNALTKLLASDVRVVTDGGGKVRAALEVIDGADRVARFLVGVTRKHPGQWWRDDFTVRFATINGLPGVIVDAPKGPVQTTAFELEGDVIRALYVVRNPAVQERPAFRTSIAVVQITPWCVTSTTGSSVALDGSTSKCSGKAR